jgi:phenylacetate-coenzyme A ligase PaaK-like adenylate-forming protein
VTRDVTLPPDERLDRAALAAHQARQLERLIAAVYGHNAFYTAKLDRAGIRPETLRLPADLVHLPLTTKAELVADQAAHPPWGTAHTEPLAHYTRYCQTSSTTGRPLRWIDTNESWQWMLECWKAVYRGARVSPGDRIFFPFGLTETGPLAFECWERPGGMRLIESEYVFEVLDPVTGRAVPDGRTGELVVTNLGRTASPVIRYRTGDVVVRSSEPCRCGRTWARLDGGILSRTDDMVNVRGVNVYPTAIEAVVRRLPEIAEFRSRVSRLGAMRSISIEIELAATSEDGAAVATRLTQHLREALNLTVPVHVVAPGTLPRFEMTSRRFVVEQ